MPVAAGISAAGAVIGGVGGAYLNSRAATNAASTYGALGQQGIQAQLGMFGQVQGALGPYYRAGQGALPTLSSLLTPGPSQTSTLESLPGFQFQSEWGGRSATNALAERGLGGSTGPLAQAISQYNQGLAGTAFGTLVGQEQNFASMGSGAAGALAGNATATGGNISNTLTGIGQAQAQGITGSASALASGLNTATGGVGNAALLSSLFANGNNNSNFYGVSPNAMNSTINNSTWGMNPDSWGVPTG
jgi:trimeric autotransporter adhesin